MADFSYDAFDAEAGALPVPGRFRRATNAAGAAVSVALMIGLTVWGYQLAVREARGVPVIPAEAGAMREAPVDPGGEQVAHQGLAVNTVAAVGEVAAPADRLMLAPRPVELSDLDQAGFQPIPLSAVVPTLTPRIPAPGMIPDEGTSTDVLEGDDALIALEPEVGIAPAPLRDPVVGPVADTAVVEGQPGIAAEGMAQSAIVAAVMPLDALADTTAAVTATAVEATAVTTAVVTATAVEAALADVVAADPEPVIAGSPLAVASSPRPVVRPQGVVLAAVVPETPVPEPPLQDAVMSPICWTAGNRVPFDLSCGEHDSARVRRSNRRMAVLLNLQPTPVSLHVEPGQHD